MKKQLQLCLAFLALTCVIKNYAQDVSTGVVLASSTSMFSVQSQENKSSDLTFNNDETKMFVIGDFDNMVEHSLSMAIHTEVDADLGMSSLKTPEDVNSFFTLTTSATNGTITTDVSPTDGTYNEGTGVELTATPDAGYEFTGWSGDATGTDNPLSITMDTDKSITAVFTEETCYVNIPDGNFKVALIGNIDINTNDDDQISCDEAQAFTGAINVAGWSIDSLIGIEAFTNITRLSCNSNDLTSLDVSKNIVLEELYCNSNDITSLDVSGATALIHLNCGENVALGSLDVSKNKALEGLVCNSNSLTSLDISENTALVSLLCFSNSLTSLDVSNNTALMYLQCDDNALARLDVSENTALVNLSCFYNALENLVISSNNTALESLICFSNSLTSLDVSGATALKGLTCDLNSLTSLDVSVNTALEGLSCNSNDLERLNVANGNNINFTSLNATNNPNLTCIQVDDVAYSNTNWSFFKDDIASFSTNCSASANIVDEEFNNAIAVYPNPVNSRLIVALKSSDIFQEAKIYNLLGKEILTSKEKEIDMNDLKSGMYVLKIESEEGKIAIKKIVKE